MIRRLLWVTYIGRLVTLVIVVWLSVWLAHVVLGFGAQLKYDAFDTLGPQVVAVLTRINPYIWWVVVMLGGLIVLSALRAAYRHSVANAKSKIISLTDTQRIVHQASLASLDVLQWAWDSDRHPLTVGDLQRTIQLIRSNKASQLILARNQSALIADALAHPHPNSPTEARWVHKEPHLKSDPS